MSDEFGEPIVPDTLQTDAARIFFGIEHDLHSIIDLANVLSPVFETGKAIPVEQVGGLQRILLTIGDHALSILADYQRAFPGIAEEAGRDLH